MSPDSRHLIFIAHGSRRAASNDEVRAVSDALATEVAGRYAQVHCAFLELADPSIGEAIDQAVTAGASRVDLFPYFLAAGRHVSDDIPEIVAERRRRYPGVELRLGDHLGASDDLTAFIARALP